MPRLTQRVRCAFAPFAAFALALALGACGGAVDTAVTPPSGTTLGLSATGIKTLGFTWTAVPGASTYQLQKNVNSAGWVDEGSTLAAPATSVTVPLPARSNALYRLQACNTAGCTTGGELAVFAPMLAAIGYVKASNTQAGDYFGNALALSADGNTLAVGAYVEDSAATGINGDQSDNTASYSGAVYVYTRSGSTWSQQAYVKASNTQAYDYFGSTLALSADGSTLAVGAYGEQSAATGINGDQTDNTADRSGAAYVFTRSGSTWSQQAYVKASNTQAVDYFGYTLALSADGNTLAVGAYGEDSAATGINGNELDNSTSDSGAAYVFTRSGSSWSQQAYVKASNTGAYDDVFGYALALSADGNTLAVGAYQEESAASGINGDQADNTLWGSGAVYVYTRSGSSWSQQAYVKASNPGDSDYFGYALALSADGNTLAVGAYREESAATGINGDQSDNTAGSSGAVYVFIRSASTWSQQAYVKASNAQADDIFGVSLALSADGNTLAVGASGEESAASGINGDQSDNTAGSSGAVYVFTRSASTWSQHAYVKASNTESSDRFGVSLALSADGSMLVVGAYQEDSAATGINGDQTDNTASNSGAVYMY